MASKRPNRRTNVRRTPLHVAQLVDHREHYGIPERPYVRGASKGRLVLCDDCKAYMPPDHPCPGTPVAEEDS